MFLKAFVFIAPGNFKQRHLIRSTWASQHLFSHHDITFVYALGMSSNATINRLVREESQIYNDILQMGSFNDSYSLGTRKLMKIYKWISIHCVNSIFMLKINDDVIMNTFKVIEYFRKNEFRKRSIFGLKIENGAPVRDTKSKFYLNQDQYGSFKFPPYPDGILFVLFLLFIQYF